MIAPLATAVARLLAARFIGHQALRGALLAGKLASLKNAAEILHVEPRAISDACQQITGGGGAHVSHGP